MPKTITMRAKVAFDYRGAKIRPGDTFTPQSAVDAVVLKNRKKADFERAPRRAVAPTDSRPSSPSTSLETSQLTADDTVDPGDSPLTLSEPTGRGRRGRGRYNRQDLRAQQ